MGADYTGQKLGIKALRIFFALPWIGKKMREYLCHHLRNELSVIINGAEIKRFDLIKAAAWHIVEDLKKIGC